MYKTIKSDNFTWSNREKIIIGKINNLITFQEDATEKRRAEKICAGKRLTIKRLNLKRRAEKRRTLQKMCRYQKPFQYQMWGSLTKWRNNLYIYIQKYKTSIGTAKAFILLVQL